MKFNETYYVVRWREYPDDAPSEKTFRSLVKANQERDRLLGEGFEAWVEVKTI